MKDGRKWRVIESHYPLFFNVVHDRTPRLFSSLQRVSDLPNDTFIPNHCTVAQSHFRGKLESSTFHSCENHTLLEIIWPKGNEVNGMTNEIPFDIVDLYAVVTTHMQDIGVADKDVPDADDITDLIKATAAAQRAQTLRNVIVFLHEIGKWNDSIYPIMERIDELLRAKIRDSNIDLELGVKR